ncbi:peptidoglycan DD-metalloendopeptidase family protein [Candidatus Omnitrophota bacterium]
MSAFLALIFFINVCAPAYAARPGNFGTTSSFEAFAGGFLSGAFTAFSCWLNPASGALSFIASDQVSMNLYYYDYARYNEPWRIPIIGITLGKGQVLSMAAGVVTGAAVGFIQGAVNGGTEVLESTLNESAKAGAESAATSTIATIANAVVSFVTWIWEKLIWASLKNAYELITDPITVLIRLGKAIIRIADAIKDALIEAGDALIKAVDKAFSGGGIFDQILKSIEKAFSSGGLFDRIIKFFENMFSEGGFFDNLLNRIGGWFKEGGFFDKIADAFRKGGFFSRTWSKITDAFRKGGFFERAANSTWNYIKKTFTSKDGFFAKTGMRIVNSVVAVAKWVYKMIIKPIYDWLKDTFTKDAAEETGKTAGKTTGKAAETGAKVVGEAAKSGGGFFQRLGAKLKAMKARPSAYYFYGTRGWSGLFRAVIQLAVDLTVRVCLLAIKEKLQGWLKDTVGLDEDIANIGTMALMRYIGQAVKVFFMKAFATLFGLGISNQGFFLAPKENRVLTFIDEQGDVQIVVFKGGAGQPSTDIVGDVDPALKKLITPLQSGGYRVGDTTFDTYQEAVEAAQAQFVFLVAFFKTDPETLRQHLLQGDSDSAGSSDQDAGDAPALPHANAGSDSAEGVDSGASDQPASGSADGADKPAFKGPWDAVILNSDGEVEILHIADKAEDEQLKDAIENRQIACLGEKVGDNEVMFYSVAAPMNARVREQLEEKGLIQIDPKTGEAVVLVHQSGVGAVAYRIETGADQAVSFEEMARGQVVMSNGSVVRFSGVGEDEKDQIVGMLVGEGKNQRVVLVDAEFVNSGVFEQVQEYRANVQGNQFLILSTGGLWRDVNGTPIMKREHTIKIKDSHGNVIKEITVLKNDTIIGSMYRAMGNLGIAPLITAAVTMALLHYVFKYKKHRGINPARVYTGVWKMALASAAGAIVGSAVNEWDWLGSELAGTTEEDSEGNKIYKNPWKTRQEMTFAQHMLKTVTFQLGSALSQIGWARLLKGKNKHSSIVTDLQHLMASSFVSGLIDAFWRKDPLQGREIRYVKQRKVVDDEGNESYVDDETVDIAYAQQNIITIHKDDFDRRFDDDSGSFIAFSEQQAAADESEIVYRIEETTETMPNMVARLGSGSGAGQESEDPYIDGGLDWSLASVPRFLTGVQEDFANHLALAMIDNMTLGYPLRHPGTGLLANEVQDRETDKYITRIDMIMQGASPIQADISMLRRSISYHANLNFGTSFSAALSNPLLPPEYRSYAAFISVNQRMKQTLKEKKQEARRMEAMADKFEEAIDKQQEEKGMQDFQELVVERKKLQEEIATLEEEKFALIDRRHYAADSTDDTMGGAAGPFGEAFDETASHTALADRELQQTETQLREAQRKKKEVEQQIVHQVSQLQIDPQIIAQVHRLTLGTREFQGNHQQYVLMLAENLQLATDALREEAKTIRAQAQAHVDKANLVTPGAVLSTIMPLGRMMMLAAYAEDGDIADLFSGGIVDYTVSCTISESPPISKYTREAIIHYLNKQVKAGALPAEIAEMDIAALDEEATGRTTNLQVVRSYSPSIAGVAQNAETYGNVPVFSFSGSVAQLPGEVAQYLNAGRLTVDLRSLDHATQDAILELADMYEALEAATTDDEIAAANKAIEGFIKEQGFKGPEVTLAQNVLDNRSLQQDDAIAKFTLVYTHSTPPESIKEVETAIKEMKEGRMLYTPTYGKLSETERDQFGRPQETLYYSYKFNPKSKNWEHVKLDRQTQFFYNSFGVAVVEDVDYTQMYMKPGDLETITEPGGTETKTVSARFSLGLGGDGDSERSTDSVQRRYEGMREDKGVIPMPLDELMAKLLAMPEEQRREARDTIFAATKALREKRGKQGGQYFKVDLSDVNPSDLWMLAAVLWGEKENGRTWKDLSDQEKFDVIDSVSLFRQALTPILASAGVDQDTENFVMSTEYDVPVRIPFEETTMDPVDVAQIDPFYLPGTPETEEVIQLAGEEKEVLTPIEFSRGPNVTTNVNFYATGKGETPWLGPDSSVNVRHTASGPYMQARAHYVPASKNAVMRHFETVLKGLVETKSLLDEELAAEGSTISDSQRLVLYRQRLRPYMMALGKMGLKKDYIEERLMGLTPEGVDQGIIDKATYDSDVLPVALLAIESIIGPAKLGSLMDSFLGLSKPEFKLARLQEVFNENPELQDQVTALADQYHQGDTEELKKKMLIAIESIESNAFVAEQDTQKTIVDAIQGQIQGLDQILSQGGQIEVADKTRAQMRFEVARQTFMSEEVRQHLVQLDEQIVEQHNSDLTGVKEVTFFKHRQLPSGKVYALPTWSVKVGFDTGETQAMDTRFTAVTGYTYSRDQVEATHTRAKEHAEATGSQQLQEFTSRTGTVNIEGTDIYLTTSPTSPDADATFSRSKMVHTPVGAFHDEAIGSDPAVPLIDRLRGKVRLNSLERDTPLAPSIKTAAELNNVDYDINGLQQEISEYESLVRFQNKHAPSGGIVEQTYSGFTPVDPSMRVMPQDPSAIAEQTAERRGAEAQLAKLKSRLNELAGNREELVATRLDELHTERENTAAEINNLQQDMSTMSRVEAFGASYMLDVLQNQLNAIDHEIQQVPVTETVSPDFVGPLQTHQGYGEPEVETYGPPATSSSPIMKTQETEQTTAPDPIKETQETKHIATPAPAEPQAAQAAPSAHMQRLQAEIEAALDEYGSSPSARPRTMPDSLIAPSIVPPISPLTPMGADTTIDDDLETGMVEDEKDSSFALGSLFNSFMEATAPAAHAASEELQPTQSAQADSASTRPHVKWDNVLALYKDNNSDMQDPWKQDVMLPDLAVQAPAQPVEQDSLQVTSEQDAPEIIHAEDATVVAARTNQGHPVVYPVAPLLGPTVVDYVLPGGEVGAYRTNDAGEHLGQDLFARKGTPIHSKYDGALYYAKGDQVEGKNTGYALGNHVDIVSMVDGREIVSTYAHLDQVEPHILEGLRSGQRYTIQAGDVIGTAGKTGNAYKTPSGKEHVHYQERVRDEQNRFTVYVNPESGDSLWTRPNMAAVDTITAPVPSLTDTTVTPIKTGLLMDLGSQTRMAAITTALDTFQSQVINSR